MVPDCLCPILLGIVLLLGGCGGDSPPAPLPQISSFSAAQDSVTVGTGTTLTAVFSNGTGTIDQSVGTVQSGAAVPTGTLTADRMYTLSVTNSDGKTVTQPLTIHAVPAPVISQFSATPNTISLGQTVTLTWSTTGATALKIDQGIGTVTGRTALQVTPTVTMTYLLTAANAAGTSVSATATVTVIAATARSYQEGDVLYLETAEAGNVRRVGVDTHWGGTIVEVSLNKANFVNANDPGRMIQTSLWDGNVDYSRQWSYNPYQAGDQLFHPSPVLARSLTADTIYTKTWPLQWSPTDSGGTTGPQASDAYIEQWVSFIPGHANGFKVHVKVTHFGTDSHALCGQEFPVVYANRGIDTLAYYDGDEPWTGGSIARTAMPLNPLRSPQFYTPENWGAYVDARDVGLTVYLPGSYPWISGFNAAGDSPPGTNEFVGITPVSWDPGSVVEIDFYVFAGGVSEARATIYALHPAQPSLSPFPPFGYLDRPDNNSSLSGTIVADGWAIGLAPITDIGAYVDGIRCGTGTYGTARDVSFAFPHTPPNVGFSYTLDTTRFADGPHTFVMKATDATGKVATFQTKNVNFVNRGKAMLGTAAMASPEAGVRRPGIRRAGADQLEDLP